MGILNVTPDSFSDGGRHTALKNALASAEAMQEAGALIIDIGGESTRPGAKPVPVDEELRRVLPVVEALADKGMLLSVDTLKPEVARQALAAGAHLINDVSGLRDPRMVEICAQAGAAVCLMHMQGEPQTMQEAPQYSDVVAEVSDYLHRETERVLAAGVADVMPDFGLGFGKTLEHNLALVRALPKITRALGRPMLVGASRKGLIGRLIGEPVAAQRDAGSIALHLFAAQAGAAMVRVHDVAGHVQALRVAEALAGAEEETK